MGKSLFVYAVVYDGYEPLEVDSLWSVKDFAERRRDQLNEGWGTNTWEVATIEVKREWPEEG